MKQCLNNKQVQIKFVTNHMTNQDGLLYRAKAH